MAEYRRQHLIPVLSLQHFVDQKGHVHTYDKVADKHWHCIPDETALAAHFYSVERDDGSMDTTVEQALWQIEDKAATAYRKLSLGEMVTGDDRYWFAYLLGTMVVRTTNARRMAAKIHALGIQNRLAATAAHDGAFSSMLKRAERDGFEVSEELKVRLRKDMVDLTDYKVAIPKERVLRALATGGKLAEIFADLRWALVRAEGHYFITCDDPVCRAVDPKTVHPIMGDGGYLNYTAEVTFPLTPKMLLVLSRRHGSSLVGRLPRAWVENENQKRAANSDKFLYAHLDDKRLVRLARRHRRDRPDIRGGLFAGGKGFGEIEVPRRRPNKK